jgi:ABC-type transport system substrate-binding protein
MLAAFFVPAPHGKYDFPQEELIKMPGYRPDKAADIAEAKKLLAEAGYAKGFSLSILARTLQTHKRAAEMLREQFKVAGIDLKLEIQETAVWAARKAKEDYDLCLHPWGVHADDPSAWLENILDPDISFRDTQLDEWKKQQSRMLDFEERKKLVRKIALRLLELLPCVPSIRSGKGIMGVWDKVKNYPVPVGIWNSHKYTEVWLAE